MWRSRWRDVVLAALHFLPFLPYNLFYLKPDRGVPQGVDVGISGAYDFGNQESNAYSGMDGKAYSMDYSDDGPFG